MTAFQRDQERTLTNSLTAKARGSFKILESLQKLYQHPWLLDADDLPRGNRSHEQAIKESPKLAECIRLLERIRERKEKVLIFTPWMRMQTLLRDVIERHFGVSGIAIINGEAKNRSQAQDRINALTNASGFEVMILSPLAAGVGLTITAANHVIHYGRWWNPAKEDQATDRVYRIGQSRPVNVYYPVLHHPGDPNGGFDVMLDKLVARKRNMARQLLEPADSHDVSAGDLQALGLRGD